MKILNTERILNTEYRIPNTEWRMANKRQKQLSDYSVFSIQNSVLFVLAEVNIGKSFTFQEGAAAKDVAEFNEVGKLVSAWLPNVYVIAGIILFFLALFGGFGVITGAGNQDKLKQGQKVLTSALVGFGILFGSYWIIQIIQVLTGVPILNPSL